MPTELARAVVLYGRVGTYETRTASLKKGMPADPDLWRTCADSIQRHIVRPWSAAGRVDVFVQSWNPELALLMDEHWRPLASDHAAQNYSLGKCPVRINYCDRTMWALLGMKRALALRMRWAEGAEGRKSPPHATVLVMRHDVIWSGSLPPLRADRSVRLWLPFDCQRASCRDRTARAADIYAEGSGGGGATAAAVDGSNALRPPPRESCSEKKGSKSPSTNWTLIKPPTTVLGVHCDRVAGRASTFCGNSVNVDWWWAGDTALANSFGETFDSFGAYSKLIREKLQFHNSAPHHYWGLFFFHTNRIRERCQLGHAGVSGVDFTLGRFVAKGSTMRSCRMIGWRAYWKPPSTASYPGKDAPHAANGGTCNASAIPGYLTMCPGTPNRPVLKVCGGESQAINATGGSRHGGHSGHSGHKGIPRGSSGAETSQRHRGGAAALHDAASVDVLPSNGAAAAAAHHANASSLRADRRREKLAARGANRTERPSVSAAAWDASKPAKSARDALGSSRRCATSA